MINKINILGVRFDNVTLEEATDIIIDKYKKNRKVSIVTANPEIVMYAYRNREYRELINSADLIVPDGIGVVLAGKILNTPFKERVPGIELTFRLLEYANSQHSKVYLLGATEEVVKKTAIKISSIYPKIQLVGYHHGYFNQNDESIIELVDSKKADIVLVATGYPRQEEWIQKYHQKSQKSIALGVGGSFDVISGTKKRAPKWAIKWNLEWAYRLLNEPQRFFRMLDLPKFVLVIIRKRIIKNKGL